MPALPDLAATMRALAFLSRVQVPDRFFDGAGHHRTADDAAAFPLAGLIIALPGAATIAAASLLGAPALLAAALAVTLTIVLTGALHEDGLADMADGFGGGHDTDRRLEIMRDSRVGTYGVLALIAGFALRVIALAAILDAAGWLAASAAWIASNAASRSALVWLWSNLPPAREDGLSANAGQPDQAAARMTMIVGGVIAAALAVVTIGFWPTGIAAIFALAAVWAFAQLARRMIGGQTGDTLGAAEQIAQIAALCGLAMLP